MRDDVSWWLFRIVVVAVSKAMLAVPTPSDDNAAGINFQFNRE
jgi:hypothetical protein